MVKRTQTLTAANMSRFQPD